MGMSPFEKAEKMREAKARKREERAAAAAEHAADRERKRELAKSDRERKRMMKDEYNRKCEDNRDKILNFVLDNADTWQDIYDGMMDAKDYKSAGKFMTDMMNIAMARMQSVKVDDKNDTQKTVAERFAKKIERIKRGNKQ